MSKYSMKSICIGSIMLVLGTVLFIIKANSSVYLDATGLLYEENFILLPISFLLLFLSVLIFTIVGIRNLMLFLKTEDEEARKVHIVITLVSLAIVVVLALLFVVLIMGNTH